MFCMTLSAGANRARTVVPTAMLRPGAVVINDARGSILDLDALLAHLQSGHIAATGLDVLPVEPVPELLRLYRARALARRAMTELMCNDKGEPIYDCTLEHLTSSAAMIIAVRKQLLDGAAADRRRGKEVRIKDIWRQRTPSLHDSPLGKPDSNLYGAFSVKSYFWFGAGSLFGAGKPFFVPSLRSGSRSAQKGVKGPKR